MPDLDEDEQFYRDTESIAFPKLDDRQLARLEPLGTRRILRGGELLFKAGQRDLGLTVVLRGELEAFEARDGQEQILATAGPREFAGLRIVAQDASREGRQLDDFLDKNHVPHRLIASRRT